MYFPLAFPPKRKTKDQERRVFDHDPRVFCLLVWWIGVRLRLQYFLGTPILHGCLFTDSALKRVHHAGQRRRRKTRWLKSRSRVAVLPVSVHVHVQMQAGFWVKCLFLCSSQKQSQIQKPITKTKERNQNFSSAVFITNHFHGFNGINASISWIQRPHSRDCSAGRHGSMV